MRVRCGISIVLLSTSLYCAFRDTNLAILVLNIGTRLQIPINGLTWTDLVCSLCQNFAQLCGAPGFWRNVFTFTLKLLIQTLPSVVPSHSVFLVRHKISA